MMEKKYTDEKNYLSVRIKWCALLAAGLIGAFLVRMWVVCIREMQSLMVPAVFTALSAALAVIVYRTVLIPYRETRKIYEQFVMGYVMEDLFKVRYPFSPESEQAVLRLNEIIDRNNLIAISKKQAEYLALQNQINPHFLYNTLDSIVWMAEGGNNRQVVEMTTDLSDFFRTVLSGGRDFITIEEEESHIRSYLKIQKIRYEDILDYSIEIEPSIRHQIVLKMLLQPLVENALYHGIKNKRGGGCIVLRGYEDRNGLVFEVEDDGIGMDEAELAAVRAKLTLEPEEELALIGSGGFGLHNVAQRIQMYYGDQAEILVESEKNIGTCFKVYLGNQKKS